MNAKTLCILLILVLLLSQGGSAIFGMNHYTPKTHPYPGNLLFVRHGDTLGIYVTEMTEYRYGVLRVFTSNVPRAGDDEKNSFIPLQLPYTKEHVQDYKIHINFYPSHNKYLNFRDCGFVCQATYRVFYDEKKGMVYLKPGPGEDHPRWEFKVVAEDEYRLNEENKLLDPFIDFSSIRNNLLFTVETIEDTGDLCVKDVALMDQSKTSLLIRTRPLTDGCKVGFYILAPQTLKQKMLYEIDSVKKSSRPTTIGTYVITVRSPYTGKKIRFWQSPSPLWYALGDKLADRQPLVIKKEKGTFKMVNPPSPFTEISFSGTNDLCGYAGPVKLKLCVKEDKKAAYTGIDENCIPTDITAEIKDGNVIFTYKNTKWKFSRWLSLQSGPEASFKEMYSLFYVTNVNEYYNLNLPFSTISGLSGSINWNADYCKKNYDFVKNGIVEKDDLKRSKENYDQKKESNDDRGSDKKNFKQPLLKTAAPEGWKAKITQNPAECKAGKACTLTFKLSTGENELTDEACVIGVLPRHSAPPFTGTIGEGSTETKNRPFRWVVSCKALTTGIKKTLTFPTKRAYTAPPRAYLYPMNLVKEKYSELLNALKDKTKNTAFFKDGINDANLVWSPGRDNIIPIPGSSHPLAFTVSSSSPSPPPQVQTQTEAGTNIVRLPVGEDGLVWKSAEKGYKIIKKTANDEQDNYFLLFNDKVVAFVLKLSDSTAIYNNMIKTKNGEGDDAQLVSFKVVGAPVYVLDHPVALKDLVNIEKKIQLSKNRYLQGTFETLPDNSKGVTLVFKVESDSHKIDYCAAGSLKKMDILKNRKQSVNQFQFADDRNPQDILYCTNQLNFQTIETFLQLQITGSKSAQLEALAKYRKLWTDPNADVLYMDPRIRGVVGDSRLDGKKFTDITTVEFSEKPKKFPESAASGERTLVLEIGFGEYPYMIFGDGSTENSGQTFPVGYEQKFLVGYYDKDESAFKSDWKKGEVDTTDTSWLVFYTVTANNMKVMKKDKKWVVTATRNQELSILKQAGAGAVVGGILGALPAPIAVLTIPAGVTAGGVVGAIVGGVHWLYQNIPVLGDNVDNEDIKDEQLLIDFSKSKTEGLSNLQHRGFTNYLQLDSEDSADLNKKGFPSGNVVASDSLTGHATGEPSNGSSNGSSNGYPGFTATCTDPAGKQHEQQCYSLGACYAWLKRVPCFLRTSELSAKWKELVAAANRGEISDKIKLVTESVKPTPLPETPAQAQEQRAQVRAAEDWPAKPGGEKVFVNKCGTNRCFLADFTGIFFDCMGYAQGKVGETPFCILSHSITGDKEVSLEKVQARFDNKCFRLEVKWHLFPPSRDRFLVELVDQEPCSGLLPG